MTGRTFAAVALSLAVAGTAQAQYGCPATTNSGTPIQAAGQNAVHDACVQAGDVFQYVAPQLGLAIAGGNATIGQGGTLGGFPHFTVSVRGNVLAGDLPQVNNFPAPRTSSTQPAQELPSKTQVVGLPVVDAAIGVFKGLPLGITNVGGVDLLVSAAYLPNIGGETDDFQLKPHTNLQLGFGARVGLLQESLLVPGISATFFERDLPKADIFGRSTNVNLSATDLSVKTRAWRVVASKSLILFGLAAGIGQDTYDQSAVIQGSVNNLSTPVGTISQTSGPVSLAQKVTRTNMFADVSMNLLLFKLVGEIGQVSGGDVQQGMYNTFSGGSADKSRLYGSVGLRFGF